MKSVSLDQLRPAPVEGNTNNNNATSTAPPRLRPSLMQPVLRASGPGPGLSNVDMRPTSSALPRARGGQGGGGMEGPNDAAAAYDMRLQQDAVSTYAAAAAAAFAPQQQQQQSPLSPLSPPPPPQQQQMLDEEEELEEVDEDEEQDRGGDEKQRTNNSNDDDVDDLMEHVRSLGEAQSHAVVPLSSSSSSALHRNTVIPSSSSSGSSSSSDRKGRLRDAEFSTLCAIAFVVIMLLPLEKRMNSAHAALLVRALLALAATYVLKRYVMPSPVYTPPKN